MSVKRVEFLNAPSGIIDRHQRAMLAVGLDENMPPKTIKISTVNGIDSYTTLMLHLDNNVIDSEITPKLVTNNGVTFSNSSPEFASFYYGTFDGATTYLIVPNSTDFDFPGDFTVDFWIYVTSSSSVQTIIGNTDVDSNGSAQSVPGWSLSIYNGAISFAALIAPSTHRNFRSGTVSQNTWHHIAVVRSSGIISLYVDGVIHGPFSCSDSIVSSSNLYIGSDQSNSNWFSGNLGEIRISKGIARWTTNSFTPPISPYEQAGIIKLNSSNNHIITSS